MRTHMTSMAAVGAVLICSAAILHCSGSRTVDNAITPDTGTTVEDTGDIGLDAGVVQPDGGDVHQDSGQDTGPAEQDSGDAGNTETDGGDSGQDEGAAEPDGGDLEQDAGLIEPDGGADATPDGGTDSGVPECTSFDTPTEDCKDFGGTTGTMCRVPAGCFWMGCNTTVDPQCGIYDTKFPYQSRYLPEYYVDKYEVTTDRYTAFLESFECQTSIQPYQGYPKCNLGRAGKGADPMNCLFWDLADTYCRFIGKRLPNGAEWEKAARGTDARLYPWGDTEANCDYAVMDVGSGPGCGSGYSMPVGSRPEGKSPYGAEDMSGNVAEYVTDMTSDEALARGGAFIDTSPLNVRTYHAIAAGYSDPEYQHDVGFRCIASDDICQGSATLPRAYVNFSPTQVVPMSAGGYQVVGRATCGTTQAAAVLKVASDGTPVWQRSFSPLTSFNAAAGTADGGMILLSGESFVKLAADGAVEWIKQYTGGAYSSTTSMTVTSDGGYVVTGNYGPYKSDAFVYKLSSTGGIEWTKSYNGTQVDRLNSIAQTGDGGYVVAGDTNSFVEGGYYFTHVWVLKVDSTGGIQWQNQYGLPSRGVTVGAQVAPVSGGGYVVTADTNTPGPLAQGPSDIIVLKLAPDGTMEWQHAYSAGAQTFASSLISTADGGFLIGANSAEFLKFNSTGELEWQRSHSRVPSISSASVTFMNASPKPDGGYVVALQGKIPRTGPWPVSGWNVAVIAELNADGTMENGPPGDTNYMANVDASYTLTAAPTTATVTDLSVTSTDNTLTVTDLAPFPLPNCWR